MASESRDYSSEMTAFSPACDRANTRLSELVEKALHIALESSPHSAAKLLTDGGADFALVVRVLSEPNRVRSPPMARSDAATVP
jgi:hypothetical protein